MDEHIVAISGASGAILGVEVLRATHRLGLKVHVVVSDKAQVTLRHEMALEVNDLREIAYRYHEIDDMFAPIASGSYISAQIASMVLVPCSMKTLSAVAHGYGGNLITRAADVMIKERKRLVIVPRETPLSPIHLENMLKLSNIGVTIHPPIPSFYQKPSALEDMIRQIAGRILDQMGIRSDLPDRWGLADMKLHQV